MSSKGLWYFAKLTELLIHKIHNYPARFPAFIVNEALSYAKEKGVKVNTIADVFCGCGTTAVEAKRNNKNFLGWDINPIATLITRTKCGEYNDKTLEKHFMAIMGSFSKKSISEKEIRSIHDRIKYWFDEDRIRDLLKLRRAIYEVVNTPSPYKKFFLCAFSNILKPTSRWLTKSIKPQIDQGKRPLDVIDTFERQFAQMRRANENNPKNNPSKHYHKPFTRVCNNNFLATRCSPPHIDLIVTSPPYVTSYDYADLHQLSLLWLGFTQDHRALRKYMIGNLYAGNQIGRAHV